MFRNFAERGARFKALVIPPESMVHRP